MTDPEIGILSKLAHECGFGILGQCTLPGQQALYEPVPPEIDQRIRDLLHRKYPQGLYRYQSRAINEALSGHDICLATSTASGKSLVFMTVALEILLRDPMAKILAFYPVRALIQDQMDKWHSVLDPMSIQLGYIDGGVPVEQRLRILARSRVVLMTPDVAHAWLMSKVNHRYVDLFLRRVRLLVLDEAHVYDGVFGTNMAYFLRRLRAFAANHQIICSTATVGEPSDFMEKLVGRSMRIFDINEDTSSRPHKSVLLCRSKRGDSFENAVELLKRLADLGDSRFLAFGDSRKMVERIVAATLRQKKSASDAPEPDEETEGGDDEETPWEPSLPNLPRILPYRAGYEAEDRKEIQNALAHGGLAGVVSTSALELGLDIGEIKIVVLLNTPPTVKAFHQRLGRAGRRSPAVCLALDDQENIQSLEEHLARKMEPSWLYLENRYIQYANALCAAQELASAGRNAVPKDVFANLPETFMKFLENELNPTDVVPSDLYPLKQRAASGNPHHEFPIRSQMEQDFRVSTFQGIPLGSLSFSQVLREAYPGAIYYYMARAHRVRRFSYRNGEIKVMRERQWTTRPFAQSMVFPRFSGGTLYLAKSDVGFLAETEVQVSERVTGFEESRGPNRISHEYGPDSEFHQSSINRFFLTTGVCWYFPKREHVSEILAAALCHAFSHLCGVQDRDLGIGMFYSRVSPLGQSTCQGMSIYDSTNGSLRLTQRLAEKFAEVIELAGDMQLKLGNGDVARDLRALKHLVHDLTPSGPMSASGLPEAGEDSTITIAPGQRAIYRHDDGCQEVEVVGHRYTPRGLMLQLLSAKEGTTWMAASQCIEPIHGITKMIRLNLVTGDVEPLEQELQS